MRAFTDADRAKKRGRIQLPDNPGSLDPARVAAIEDAVRATVSDGYVACPGAWRIAADLEVERIDVGAAVDRLGLRVRDCQLGCFAVEKTGSPADPGVEVAPEVAAGIEALRQQDGLTCPAIFALAGELGVPPRAVADGLNARGYKFGGCQLGCF